MDENVWECKRYISILVDDDRYIYINRWRYMERDIYISGWRYMERERYV